jgi:hypothetical protein
MTSCLWSKLQREIQESQLAFQEAGDMRTRCRGSIYRGMLRNLSNAVISSIDKVLAGSHEAVASYKHAIECLKKEIGNLIDDLNSLYVLARQGIFPGGSRIPYPHELLEDLDQRGEQLATARRIINCASDNVGKMLATTPIAEVGPLVEIVCCG